jgi:hypothetical protein
MLLAMSRSSQRSGREARMVQFTSLPGTIAYLVLGRFLSKTLRRNPPNFSGE